MNQGIDKELAGMMANELQVLQTKIVTGVILNPYDMDMLSGIIGHLRLAHTN